jgi:hypothetical protein
MGRHGAPRARARLSVRAQEVSDAMAYLHLLHDAPRSDVFLERVINTPARNVGELPGAAPVAGLGPKRAPPSRRCSDQPCDTVQRCTPGEPMHPPCYVSLRA